MMNRLQEFFKNATAGRLAPKVHKPKPMRGFVRYVHGSTPGHTFNVGRNAAKRERRAEAAELRAQCVAKATRS